MSLTEKVSELMTSHEDLHKVVYLSPWEFFLCEDPLISSLVWFFAVCLIFCIATDGSFDSRSIPNFCYFALDFKPFLHQTFLCFYFFLLYDRTPSNERTIDDLN